MSVVVSVQDVGPCRKQLTVEVPAPAVEAETQRVIQEYGRQVRIPGFRQGKVPANVVRQRFAKDIEKEVVERLLPRYWHQAQAEASIDPLLPPEVDEVRDLQPGQPLTFVATVEIRPQIELRNIRDFDLPDPQVDPGQMEVDDAIEDLRKQIAPWVTVERPAARGDKVSAEIAEITGEEGAEGKVDPVQVELGDERVWEELTAALQGTAAGQEVTFTRHEPAVQHGDHEHPARDRRFRVRVVEVQERDLPALDDELARKLSPDLGGLDALRDVVTKRLRSSKLEQRSDERQKALLDQLRERHPLDLPEGVVRREVEQLTQEYAENLARRGMDIERAPIDWNEVAGGMMPLAERRVHARLLLDAIADAESIHVDENEFESTLAYLARAQNTSTPALRKSLDENGRLSGLRAQLRRDKTMRHLLGETDAAGDAAAVTAGLRAQDSAQD